MKDEKARDLTVRTKQYALRVIRLYGALPNDVVSVTLGKQLLRSATSVGAHYREAKRARSDAEFISKVQVALQELDESAYWLELLMEAGSMNGVRLHPLLNETNELIAILTTVVKKVKRRNNG